jgi:hypothetical protein
MYGKNLIIATYATERYAYALPSVIRNIASALYYCKEFDNIKIVLVTDESTKVSDLFTNYFNKYIGESESVELVQLPLKIKTDGLNNYKEAAQLIIAQMQTEAFCYARRDDADFFWSIESDVLVPPNALQVSMDSLNYDKNYYDVCMCSYPSQGGGSFLGGHGSYEHHINEDFEVDERDVEQGLLDELNEREEQAGKKDFKPSKEWLKRGHEIGELIKNTPPKGNVFEMNAKKWRRRGWMEHAYPALGKGALLPTDWVGLGCTLMSRKALALASFDGYQGMGTQDLYLGWNFWIPNDIKLCVSTHAVCDHIVRDREGEKQSYDKFIHAFAHHEPEGEFKGHLRQRHVSFYNHVEGEKPLGLNSEEKTNKKKIKNS